jgi:hypothetical protein
MIETSGQRAALRHRRSTDVVLLKDLAPRKDVRGGKAKRLFGERQDKAAATRKAGGTLTSNSAGNRARHGRQQPWPPSGNRRK